MNEDGTWQWHEFANLIPLSICLAMTHIRPKNVRLTPDKITWKHTRDGYFSIKYSYEFLTTGGTSEDKACWNYIWRLSVTKRIRYFTWLLTSNKLLINAERWRRYLTDNNNYQLCQQDREDELHAIRDCPTSKQVWMNIIDPYFTDTFFSPF